MRIGNYTPSVAGTAQVDAAPLSVEIDETDQNVTINYAPAADGLITDADTIGEVQAEALDLVLRGLANELFGNAAVGTDLTRPVPWEVPFSGGQTVIITFDGVAGGPEQNVFMGATEQDAIDALDAYTAANPTWADAYMADQRLTVALRWGAGDGTTYLRDATGMWRDIGLVWLKGQRGTMGRDGTDGDDGDDYDPTEVLAARDRAEAAAAAAAASETAAAASETAAGASEAAAGGSALTADAAESDASDSRVAAGVSQMGAADSATAAETSADRAERFAAQSQTAAQGNPRGSLLATSPVLPVANRGPSSRYPFGTNRWTVTADGVAAGLTAGGTDEEHLFFPRLAPAGLQGYWLQVLVGGVVTGEAHRPHGYHVVNRSHFPLLERIYAGQDSSDNTQFVNVDWRGTGFELYGSGTTLSANTTVRVLESVVRGDKGDKGDPGVGITQAQYDALVARVAALEAGGGGQVIDHTTRAAISVDEVLTAAEVNAGTTTDDEDVTMPVWQLGRRYLYIGIPEAEDDITDLETGGIPVFHAWERVAGIIEAHKWWKTINDQSTAASGAVYTIIQ